MKLRSGTVYDYSISKNSHLEYGAKCNKSYINYNLRLVLVMLTTYCILIDKLHQTKSIKFYNYTDLSINSLCNYSYQFISNIDINSLVNNTLSINEYVDYYQGY